MRLSGPRRYRVLAIAIVLSVAIHFVVGPLLSRFHHAQPSDNSSDFVVTSTSLRISRKTVPQPHPRPQPHVRPQPRILPHRTIAQTIVAPKLLTTPQPRGVQPRAVPSIDTITLEREQRQYEKTIAQAKADNNPLAVPSSTPAAYKRYTLSFAGINSHLLHAGEGVLYPTKSWQQDGYDYYYVDYTVVFADGTHDEGHVPWPIRYRPGEDPFVRHYQHFPLPAPLPGYVLPQSELPLNRTLRPYFPEIYPNGG